MYFMTYVKKLNFMFELCKRDGWSSVENNESFAQNSLFKVRRQYSYKNVQV